VIETLQLFIASLMSRVRVNQIRRSKRGDVAVIVKRRRFGGSVIVWFGNLFLTLTGSQIRMFPATQLWIAWEIHCAELLYPDRARVTTGASHSVIMPQLNGVSLRQLLRSAPGHPKACIAAARELRRVHQIFCREFEGQWSHGDFHAGNVLYDELTDQVTLIDFDTRHEFSARQTWRHADDLSTMLLEFLTLPDDTWIQAASVFLQEYADIAVLDELARQLFIPTGFAKVLWLTRTGGHSSPQIQPRLATLKRIIQQLANAGRSASHTQTLDHFRLDNSA
jgi:hypothetical protein